MSDFLDTKIEFLTGVGPVRAKLLAEELGIFFLRDLVSHFPFRYEDRSKFTTINQIGLAEGNVQIKGVLVNFGKTGPPRRQRLVAALQDATGQVELVWFKGAQWIASKLKIGTSYIVYGKPSLFHHKYSISHPEFEVLTQASEKSADQFVPVYSITEKLKGKYLDSRAIFKLQKTLIGQPNYKIVESIDKQLLQSWSLIDLQSAFVNIHQPKSQAILDRSILRLKFDELFFIQLKLFLDKSVRKQKHSGFIFSKSKLLTQFYHDHLPFSLTDAQKKVIREIYADFQSGIQMNRLLQGDVGSGKTITAFICMLIAIDSGFQCAIMAPTEILATQHFQSLHSFAEKLNLEVALITGSTKKSARTKSLAMLIDGEIDILIGTHALIEEDIQFQHLGLAVIDEQHRFGVAQRAKLWKKSSQAYPHVLVMTATPIPRTLAMTLYGDLDVSTIDELPAGRKPIITTHLKDTNRSKLFGFVKQKIEEDKQVYFVYPLIEESDAYDFKDLMDGYESISRAFKNVPLSILHGRMKPADKAYEMKRFVKVETKIMVATTVIEVGVDVPNASVMVIENAERFGLSQLHQLRGRVGRGSDQSYCILMTGNKLSTEARERIKTMVKTNDGFEIAEKDLELRGPGDLMGTQQSGLLDLNLADLTTDGAILKKARTEAEKIVEADPQLLAPEHACIRAALSKSNSQQINWSRIS